MCVEPVDVQGKQAYADVMSFRACLLLAILAFAAPASAADRNFVVTDFEEIRLIGPHEVTTTPGRATIVRGSGDRQALDALIVETRDKVLTIRTRSTAISEAEKRPVRIAISAPLIRVVRLNGSGSISAADLSGAAVEASLTGSGTVAVGRIRGDMATLHVTGSGALRAAGNVRSIDASLRGAGTIDGASLNAADLKLVSAGSGTVTLAASRAANVSFAGSGTVNILGRPSCTVKNSGTGSVTCGAASDQKRPSASN